MAKITREEALAEIARRKQEREKQQSAPEEKQGWAGIGQDVSDSAANFLPATGRFLSALPSSAMQMGKNIMQHPIRSPLNFLAGMGEGAIGLQRAPANIAQYMADKKLMTQNDADTYKKYQIPDDLGIERRLGLDKPDSGDNLIKMLGSFLAPGKAAKLMGGGKLAHAGAFAAQAAGENQDPIHAALMATLVPYLAKKGMSVVKGIPDAVNRAAGILPDDGGPGGAGGSPAMNAPIDMQWGAQLPNSVSWVGNIPQAMGNITKGLPEALKNAGKSVPRHAGSALAAALEATANMASEAPGVGKFIAPVVQPTLGMAGARLKYASVTPETLAKEKLFGDITAEDLPSMEERAAAGNRMGMAYLTPSELMNDAYESAKQAEIGRTRKGQKELYDAGEKREGTEESAINGLFDMIHESKLDPIKKAAYEKSMSDTVPSEFIEKYKSKPVIEQAMKAMKGKSAYRQLLHDEYGKDWDKATPNSFMYWDMIKRVLDDFEQKAKRKGGGTEQSVYGNIRRSMINEMDQIQPEYKIARNIAERGYTRKKLEDVFDKKDKTFNNFDSFLKSKENMKEMTKKLSAFPEALQRLNDIKMYSGKMIPNNPGVRAAAALKRNAMSDARNPLDAKFRKMEQKYGENHDVAAVRLMTLPPAELMQELKKHLREKGKI